MASRPPVFRSHGQRTRAIVRRDHDQKRRGADPWRAWYKSAAWRDLRAAQLQREPLCERCLIEEEIITAADIVHHRDPHRGEWSRFVDPDNLASVCKRCHDGEIQRGERAGWTQREWLIEGHSIQPRIVQPLGLAASAVPLTLICGPPGAGKNTYVRLCQADSDIVIDIDAILDELSGTKLRTQERRDTWLQDAFIERNKRLAALSIERRPVAAWFIVGAAQPSVRELWARQLQPHDVIVVETPAHVCHQRIMADPARRPTAATQLEGVRLWWDRYWHSEIDTKRFPGC